jgi:hypothetical protein
MRQILLAWALVAMAGCDFSTPLVTAPEMNIDPALTGLWRTSGEDGQSADLLVLPWSKREYLVSYLAGTGNSLFARAALWQGGEARLLQLDWFGTARGTVPDSSKTFQFARFALEGDTLKVELVQPTDELKGLTAQEDLARALREQWKTPELFSETLVFKRIRPDAPSPAGQKAPDEKPVPGETSKPVPEV